MGSSLVSLVAFVDALVSMMMESGGHLIKLERTKDSSTIKAIEDEKFALWFRLSNRHEGNQRKSWYGPDWSGSRMEVD